MNTVRWDRLLVLIIGVGLVWALMNGGLPTILSPGNPPPFPTDKLSGLIVYDASPTGVLALSNGQRNVIEGNSEESVKEYFRKHGGYELQTIDKGNLVADLSYPWMKDAVKVIVEQKTLPWMVVATPKAGDSFALPPDTSTEAVLTRLKPLVENK